ncbi:E3 ubiquitin- ligase ARI4 [Fusarium albosuccineum]|uniref:E3 ubiquitin- ligase ARI4 n=1 Tax=Fusarium albosuccineum TaxID=1237068 RepID=A0A8H4L7U7_9HYPO|nr:E3 ubiquitin- ligase ARI4 [Fusarium albosuccineum]
MAGAGDAWDRVHPELIDLMFRHEVVPNQDVTEETLARTIFLAIELADPFEQADIVSRIVSEEEVARQRLQNPDVRNIQHRIALDAAERRAALCATPEPERQVERHQGPNLGECLICGEQGHITTACRHAYCLPCLRESIRLGLQSENDFPPRCCEHFTEETIRLAQRPALVHLFRQLEEEVQVPVPDRLYCHDRSCATFIPPGGRGECPACGLGTCERCQAMAHEGECEEGEIVENVWETMDRNQCICSAHFCFVCGERWKTCECPLYGGHDQMVPIRLRPGLKPEQFRRERRQVDHAEPAPVENLRIPQLRPRPGEQAFDVGHLARRGRIRPLHQPGELRLPILGPQGEAEAEPLLHVGLQQRDNNWRPNQAIAGEAPRNEELVPGRQQGIIPNPQPADHRLVGRNELDRERPDEFNLPLRRRARSPPRDPGPARHQEQLFAGRFAEINDLLEEQWVPPGAGFVPRGARGWWRDQENENLMVRIQVLGRANNMLLRDTIVQARRARRTGGQREIQDAEEELRWREDRWIEIGSLLDELRQIVPVG